MDIAIKANCRLFCFVNLLKECMATHDKTKELCGYRETIEQLEKKIAIQHQKYSELKLERMATVLACDCKHSVEEVC